MTTKRMSGVIMLILILLFAVGQLSADVVHESKTQMKLSGALGTMSKIMGLGKPIQTVDYYSGNKMRSDQVDDKGKIRSSEIVDLDKEVFITLNHKKKKYTQMTFAEWRQQIEDAMAKMNESEPEQSEEAEQPENEWTVSFDMSTPDGTENVNGRDARKVIMTVIAKEKSQDEAEDTAGPQMKMTSTSWICSTLEGSDEINAFNTKLAQKLGFGFDEAQSQNIWEQIMQSYPQVKDISETVEEKGQGLEGTPIKTYAVYETIGQVKPAGQDEEEETPTSVGGLMKGFGKKAIKKDDDKGPKPLIEITSDVVRQEVTPVDQTMFTVPENYKLDK